MRSILLGLMITTIALSCNKKDKIAPMRYFQVGFKSPNADWRDTAYIVATNNPQLLTQVDAELAKPVAQRKIVTGPLLRGSGGYNRNVSFVFNWRLDEQKWKLADVTAEIYDGKPYTDIEQHLNYWVDMVKGFGAWSSYIKSEVAVIIGE